MHTTNDPKYDCFIICTKHMPSHVLTPGSCSLGVFIKSKKKNYILVVVVVVIVENDERNEARKDNNQLEFQIRVKKWRMNDTKRKHWQLFICRLVINNRIHVQILQPKKNENNLPILSIWKRLWYLLSVIQLICMVTNFKFLHCIQILNGRHSSM